LTTYPFPRSWVYPVSFFCKERVPLSSRPSIPSRRAPPDATSAILEESPMG